MVTKFWLILMLATHLFAHKIEGINLILTPLENDKMSIEGKMKGSGKKLEGNKIALISMIDKRVLEEAFLEGNRALHVKIPQESYWVYLYVGDQDVVEEGPPPRGGFKKVAVSQKERAFRTMTTLCLSFIALFFIVGGYRIYHYKKPALQM
ncbi:hypothetical protein [Sulfurospirillum arsenophilum]|uniref:hypothetical protein n=1 Tax=Sulfurospirillum arsenophilum TaxID=56698 RepID=UPI0005A6BABD|nr:hypothetical protein [Sulfurospirillum arsenophilum]